MAAEDRGGCHGNFGPGCLCERLEARGMYSLRILERWSRGAYGKAGNGNETETVLSHYSCILLSNGYRTGLCLVIYTAFQ